MAKEEGSPSIRWTVCRSSESSTRRDTMSKSKKNEKKQAARTQVRYCGLRAGCQAYHPRHPGHGGSPGRRQGLPEGKRGELLPVGDGGDLGAVGPRGLPHGRGVQGVAHAQAARHHRHGVRGRGWRERHTLERPGRLPDVAAPREADARLPAPSPRDPWPPAPAAWPIEIARPPR